MGEEFLRKQNERFEHGRDRAQEKLSQADLLTTRPELVGRAFQCSVMPQYKMPEADTQLVLADSKDGILLLAADGPIGTVRESEASYLRELMAATPDLGRMLQVSVLETADFLGEFTVRVSTEEPEE